MRLNITDTQPPDENKPNITREFDVVYILPLSSAAVCSSVATGPEAKIEPILKGVRLKV